MREPENKTTLAEQPEQDRPTEVVVQRHTPLELDRQRNARLQSAALVVLAAGAMLTLMYFAKPVLVVVLVSVLVSFMLAPIVEVCDRIRLPRPVGAGLGVLVLLGVSYGLMYFSYNRATAFFEELPSYSQKIRSAVVHVRQRAERIQKTTENVLPGATDDQKAIKVKQETSWSDKLTAGAASATETALLIGFIPFLVFFMLSWQDHVRTATVMLFSLENRNTAYVTLGLISAMIRSFIVGNLVVGLFTSVISMVVFGILGLPYFYFLGFFSGFLTLVPYLGVVLALVPPVVAGLGTLKSDALLIIVATVVGLHLFALNVLYPKFIGKRLQLNPLAVTIALLFWGWLWGAMGLILAVPVTAAMKIIFDHVDALRPWGAWLGE